MVFLKTVLEFASRRCALLVFALLCASSSARADDLQDAVRFARAGQSQQALEQVNKVLAIKPRDAQARFLKGTILAEVGSTKEAADIFLKLTQDFPELPEPYNNLAVLYAAQGQYDKARAALEKSLRTHPSYATAYENLGDVYAKLANQAYDKALQLESPGASPKNNKLALVHDLVPVALRAAQPEPVTVASASATATASDATPSAGAEAPPAAEKRAAAPGSGDKIAVAEKTVVAAARPGIVAAPSPQSVPSPKPAATPQAVQKPQAEITEVVDTVFAWAAAWSKKDANAYLAFYAKQFKPPRGEPRASWEKARRARIAAPKSISVTVLSPKVEVRDRSSASVRFRQTYRSDVFTGNSTKTLNLMKSDGRWLITGESVN